MTADAAIDSVAASAVSPTGQTGRMTRAAFDIATIGAGLSFAGAVEELSAALDTSSSVVVTAPPGTGKTTLVPPLLASRTPGRVVVTQPRRVAARAAARRLAQLDGSPLGGRVGFTVRGEHSAGADTKVEFVTAGVLLRRMLDDPGLDGVGAVIIDEVHERAIETDILVGLLSEVRELRDDLTVVAMSATLDAARIAAVIGTDESPAPVVDHDVPAFPPHRAMGSESRAPPRRTGSHPGVPRPRREHHRIRSRRTGPRRPGSRCAGLRPRRW